MSTVAGAVIDRAAVAAPLAELDQRALARLANPMGAAVKTTSERTRVCPECSRRVTTGTDGETEFGHSRGINQGEDRCPERPDRADPQRECGPA